MHKIFLNNQVSFFLERMVEGNLIVFPISHTVFEELYAVMAGQTLCIVLLTLRATTTDSVHKYMFYGSCHLLVSCPDLAMSYMSTRKKHIVTHY
jgi:hypothetical protein